MCILDAQFYFNAYEKNAWCFVKGKIKKTYASLPMNYGPLSNISQTYCTWLPFDYYYYLLLVVVVVKAVVV